MRAYDCLRLQPLTDTAQRSFKEASEALIRFICLPRDIFSINSKACCVTQGERNTQHYYAGVPQLCDSNWIGKEDKNNFVTITNMQKLEQTTAGTVFSLSFLSAGKGQTAVRVTQSNALSKEKSTKKPLNSPRK